MIEINWNVLDIARHVYRLSWQRVYLAGNVDFQVSIYLYTEIYSNKFSGLVVKRNSQTGKYTDSVTFKFINTSMVVMWHCNILLNFLKSRAFLDKQLSETTLVNC